MDIAELDQFQLREGRADAIVQRWITQVGQLLQEIFSDQVIAEYPGN